MPTSLSSDVRPKNFFLLRLLTVCMGWGHFFQLCYGLFLASRLFYGNLQAVQSLFYPVVMPLASFERVVFNSDNLCCYAFMVLSLAVSCIYRAVTNK